LNKFKGFGKLTIVGNAEFEFRGELNWHQIVDKLINMGFEQDEKWDEMCGSPSYKSQFISNDDSNDDSNESNDDSNESNDDSNDDSIDTEFKAVDYTTITKSNNF